MTLHLGHFLKYAEDHCDINERKTLSGKEEGKWGGGRKGRKEKKNVNFLCRLLC